MKKFMKTCFALFIAINLCGLRVSLFLNANLGSDSFTLLQEGMGYAMNMTIGEASRWFLVITLSIALLINRKAIGWTTIAYGLLIGYSMDFYNNLIGLLDIPNMNLFIRLITVSLGQICFILQFVVLIQYCKGMNQVDAIAYGIENHFHIPYKYARTSIDILFIVVGFILNGVIGIGTLLAMFTTGIGIDFCLKRLNSK